MAINKPLKEKVMKRIFLLAGVLAVALSSCINDDDNEDTLQKEQEIYDSNLVAINSYLDTAAMGMYMDEAQPVQGRKLFYYVEDPGSASDTLSNQTPVAVIKYKSYLLNGDLVDQSDSVRANYATGANLLAGMYYGALIANLGEGGSMQLVLPSFYAYGSGSSQGNDSLAALPANSPVRIEMEFLHVEAQ